MLTRCKNIYSWFRLQLQVITLFNLSYYPQNSLVLLNSSFRIWSKKVINLTNLDRSRFVRFWKKMHSWANDTHIPQSALSWLSILHTRISINILSSIADPSFSVNILKKYKASRSSTTDLITNTRPQQRSCMIAELRLIIDPSSVPASFSETEQQWMCT